MRQRYQVTEGVRAFRSSLAHDPARCEVLLVDGSGLCAKRALAHPGHPQKTLHCCKYHLTLAAGTQAGQSDRRQD